MNTQPLKGFRDFLPPQAAARQWLKNRIIPILTQWGYEPFETPTVEPQELFGGNVGEDEKLFFSFKDLGDRDVMLRYDQTLPTVRVVANNLNNLVMPFRRYQIQSAFRAEKPQAGRFREFTQVDFDVFGIESPTADAEVIALTIEIYRQIGFKDVIALINSRSLMKDLPYEAIVAIDKLAKIGPDGVIADMARKNITEEQAKKYLELVQNTKPNEELETIFSYLKGYGIPEINYKFSPTLARSFSYSQGPIWEIVIPGYTAGSVAGGERYDGLFTKLIGKPFPGTGIALGFDRTLEACQQFGLIPNYTTQSQILLTVFSPEYFDKTLQLSNSLRQAGVCCEVYPDTQIKLEKQLKYASKKSIPYVAFLGKEEIESDLIKLKNMTTSEQRTLSLNELITLLT